MDRADGFYWLYVNDTSAPGSVDFWTVAYWTNGAWKFGSAYDTFLVKSAGPQLQPPETGTRVRPPGYYWIQKINDGYEWQVAYWAGFQWSLISTDYSGLDDSDVLVLGPLIAQPDGP